MFPTRVGNKFPICIIQVYYRTMIIDIKNNPSRLIGIRLCANPLHMLWVLMTSWGKSRGTGDYALIFTPFFFTFYSKRHARF